MRTFHFTTVVSSYYVYKFLAMQESLKQHCKNYQLFALCIDKQAYSILKRLHLKNVILLKLSILENDELLAAKNNRNYHEYCWTLKPFILNYVMKVYKDTQYFAHLDADLFFFSNPEEIIKEAPMSSLFLTDHNNSDKFLHTYETSGRYNTGFVCCKNDSTSDLAVEWWLDKCLEKCCIVADVNEGLYGDQRYVEKWPELFQNVHIVSTKGANVAQWNIDGFKINEIDGKVYVDNDNLIFYHFSGLCIINKNEFNLTTFYKVDDNTLNMIYMPYIKTLSKYIEYLSKIYPGFKDGILDRRIIRFVHYVKI
jgi:hypothetical protein